MAKARVEKRKLCGSSRSKGFQQFHFREKWLKSMSGNFRFLVRHNKKPGRLAAKMGFWFRILFWFSTIVGTSLPRQFDPGHLRGKTPH